MAKQSSVLKVSTHSDEMNIGLGKSYLSQMSETLTDILADTYKLIIKSHVYHWNVSGPLFKPLHELTEAHYEALFAAADVIAERIRALGHIAPAHLTDATNFAPSAKSVQNLTAEAMISDLIKDHEAAVRAMRKAAGAAGDASDPVTEDMLTQQLTFHEKALWMLRAHLA